MVVVDLILTSRTPMFKISEIISQFVFRTFVDSTFSKKQRKSRASDKKFKVFDYRLFKLLNRVQTSKITYVLHG